MTTEVTDKGYPITKDGLEKFRHMVQEQENRDADIQGVRCYNDWNGWGATEVLENMLADFNKVIFKKDIAPLKKWAHVEGLVTWLKLAYLAHLMSI